MIRADDRANLHAALDRLIDYAPDLEQVQGDDDHAKARRRIESQMHIRSAFSFLRQVVGCDLIESAKFPDHGANLATAGQMLNLGISFFGDIDGQPSLGEIAFELEAIDAGELPRVIVPPYRPRKKPTNLRRRAYGQLGALAWERRLAGLGFDTADRQDLVRRAYGHRWRTIAGWESGVRSALGDFRVDTTLNFARANALRQLPIDEITKGNLLSVLETDGRAYVTENRVGKGRALRK